jgi:hypothetical protein
VEFEVFEDVIALVLARQDTDLARIRPLRQIAETLQQRGARASTVGLLPTFEVGRHRPIGDLHRLERVGHLGPCLALWLAALGHLGRDAFVAEDAAHQKHGCQGNTEPVIEAHGRSHIVKVNEAAV